MSFRPQGIALGVDRLPSLAFKSICFKLAGIFLLTHATVVEAGGRRPIDPMNPDFGATNGFGLPYISTGYAGAAGPGCRPNLGPEVPPTAMDRYFAGLAVLRAGRVSANQPEQVALRFNKLTEMEMAQNEILSFFAANYTALNKALNDLSHATGRPRYTTGVNPLAAAFGITGGTAGGPITPMDARKLYLLLSTTTNAGLYNATTKDLESYRDKLTEILSMAEPPVGVDRNEMNAHFLRIQRALAKDVILLKAPDAFVLPATAGTVIAANVQAARALVGKWLSGQGNPGAGIRSTSLGTAATDRAQLVAARGLPELPGDLQGPVDLAIARIDAAQLQALNTEIEPIDFNKHLNAFNKANAAKLTNPNAIIPPSIMDKNWIVERIGLYNDLISNINGRLEIPGLDRDWVTKLRGIVRRADESLKRLEKYKVIFEAAANAPPVRINYALQAEIMRVYTFVSQLANPVELLRSRGALPNYEAILKKALASPQDLPVGVNVIQIRKHLREVQKAIAIDAFTQLRAFEKKVDDVVQKYGLIMPGQGNADVDKAISATVTYKDGKVVTSVNEDDGYETTRSPEELAKIKKTLEAQNGGKTSEALAQEKIKRKEAEVELIKRALAGVMPALDQAAQAVLKGVFVLGGPFGAGDMTEERAMELIKKINQSLIGLQYKEAEDFNKTLNANAKAAEIRIKKDLEALGKETDKMLNLSTKSADAKWLKLGLIYGAADDATQRANMKATLADLNGKMLVQFLDYDLADLKTKFDAKMQSTLFALNTLERLDQFVTVEDTQGEGRARALELIERITAALEKK